MKKLANLLVSDPDFRRYFFEFQSGIPYKNYRLFRIALANRYEYLLDNRLFEMYNPRKDTDIYVWATRRSDLWSLNWLFDHNIPMDANILEIIFRFGNVQIFQWYLNRVMPATQGHIPTNAELSRLSVHWNRLSFAKYLRRKSRFVYESVYSLAVASSDNVSFMRWFHENGYQIRKKECERIAIIYRKYRMYYYLSFH